MENNNILVVENLVKYFPFGKGFWGKGNAYVKAVDGVSFVIKKGETLGLSYGNLVPVLTKAIQEQQATIEAQQKQIDELKAQNTALAGELKAEIEAIKKAINGTNLVQK